MTQPVLADALGITPVTVSRTIRDLKVSGSIWLRGRRLTVHDWERLVATADFDPTDLHMSR